MVVSGRMVVVGREATVVELIVVTGLLVGFAVVVVMVVVLFVFCSSALDPVGEFQ